MAEIVDPHKPTELHERVMRYVRANPGSDYEKVEAEMEAEASGRKEPVTQYARQRPSESDDYLDPHKPTELHERVMRYVRANPGAAYEEVEAEFMARARR